MLSDEMRYKIAKAYAVGCGEGKFDCGTYYTNGKRLVYLPNGIFDKNDSTFDVDGNRLHVYEIFEQEYINIQDLIPQDLNCAPDYDGLVYGYRREFMRVKNIDNDELQQNFSDADIMNWIVLNHPDKLEKCQEMAIALVERVLIDLNR